MDRLERYERIIATEYYLYGGVVDVPKVYDADSKHHSERYLKGHQETSRRRRGDGRAVILEKISGSDLDWLSTV